MCLRGRYSGSVSRAFMVNIDGCFVVDIYKLLTNINSL